MSFLGPGIPLFFDFMKWIIFILLILLWVSGIFNLVSNYQGGDCQDKKDYKEGDKNNCKLDWSM